MPSGNFKIDKETLIKSIDLAVNQSQSNDTLIKLRKELELIDSHSTLNKLISRLINDDLIEDQFLGEQLLEFEAFYRDQSNLINSEVLKQIAKYLLKNGIKMTHFGQVWSKWKANWMYFDTVLDIDQLKTKFNWGEHIIVSENLDPKSGLERGLFDQETKEGLMGKI